MESVGILRQAAIPDFAKAENAFDVPEHMLDSRSDARLATIRLTVAVAKRTITVSAPVGKIASAGRFLAHH